MVRDHVLLLTESCFLSPKPDDPYACQILLEEAWLARGLRRRGVPVARAAWDDPTIDWSTVRAAVFRSTWSYFDRFNEFEPWLGRVETQTRLFNSRELIRWNLDKHYLRDLEAGGVSVVPTHFVERGAEVDLERWMDEAGAREVIVKPAVSGGARLTYRVPLEEARAHQSILDGCAAREAMMIQPFMPAVLGEGELSLMVIAGRFTHAIRKTPKAGDFRVQDDHGGLVHPYFATAEEIAFAERAAAASPSPPLYARVDVVRDEGTLRVMEMELVEPELFFRFCTPAADRLAEAIAAELG